MTIVRSPCHKADVVNRTTSCLTPLSPFLVHSHCHRDIQILKGCMRESETDRYWATAKMPMSRIHHLRSK